MKGVPEPDIAAATGNPELMQRLILQIYGPGSRPSTSDTPLQPQPVGLRCDGWRGCQSGGSMGYGGMYSIGNQTLCESCAVKKLSSETLPSEETDILS